MKRFTDLKLKAQFQITAVLLSFLIAVNGLIILFLIKNLVVENIAQYTYISEQFGTHIEKYFGKASYIFDNLQSDDTFQAFLRNPYTKKTPFQLKEIDMQFQLYKAAAPEIADIAVVSKNIMLTSDIDFGTLTMLRSKMPHNPSVHSLGIHTTNWIRSSEKNETFLYFGKHLFFSAAKQPDAAVFIAFNIQKLLPDFTGTQRPQAGFIVTDQYMHSFSVNLDEAERSAVLASCKNLFDVSDKKYVKRKTLETNNHFLFYSYLPEIKYHCLAVLSKENYKKSFFKTVRGLCTILLVSLLCGIALTGFIFKNTLTPIRMLYNHLNAIRESKIDFNSQKLLLRGFREIEEVAASFNRMTGKLSHLNKCLNDTTVKLYESELEKKQAELEFLKSQINPHFLNNILQYIKDIAVTQHVEKIPQITDAMAALFNYKIRGAKTVRLEKEIETTKAYLAIQTLRFPGKFTVAYHIPDVLKDALMIKLLLQPLVENAIYHGLEPKDAESAVYIGAREENGTVFITVQDDGIGISDGTLQAIQAELNQDNNTVRQGLNTHIGILNVHRRIRLAYGKDYGLTVNSSKQDGTKIVLSFPLQYGRES